MVLFALLNIVFALIALYVAILSESVIALITVALLTWNAVDPYIFVSQWWMLSALLSSKVPLSSGKSIEIKCRVNPIDVDWWGHLNNARYNRYLEYARYHWLIRSGLGKKIRKLGVVWGLGGVSVRFRRELRPFQTFYVVTKLGGWDDCARSIYMEQFIETVELNNKNGKEVRFVHAHATARMVFKRGQTLNPSDVAEALHCDETQGVLTPACEAMANFDETSSQQLLAVKH